MIKFILMSLLLITIAFAHYQHYDLEDVTIIKKLLLRNNWIAYAIDEDDDGAVDIVIVGKHIIHEDGTSAFHPGSWYGSIDEFEEACKRMNEPNCSNIR